MKLFLVQEIRHATETFVITCSGLVKCNGYKTVGTIVTLATEILCDNLLNVQFHFHSNVEVSNSKTKVKLILTISIHNLHMNQVVTLYYSYRPPCINVYYAVVQQFCSLDINVCMDVVLQFRSIVLLKLNRYSVKSE